jgi:L-threonylcarbamoyladenylate synthase
MRPPLGTYPLLTWINAGQRAEAYAHALYAHLRTLDKAGCARILVQEVPADERWHAVRDRLQRAAAASSEELTSDSDALALGVLP